MLTKNIWKKFTVVSTTALLSLTANLTEQLPANSQHGALSEQEIESILVDTASSFNQKLPMMIDKETRLDNVTGGPGRRLTYLYTTINYSSNQIDPKQLYQNLAGTLKKQVCTTPDLKVFFENGVMLQYKYYGNDGGYITEVNVSPSDCGY